MTKFSCKIFIMVNKIIISLILARVISKKMRIAFRPTKKICIIIKTNLNYKKRRKQIYNLKCQ